jgi:tRNA(Ile)-lysidine synthase
MCKIQQALTDWLVTIDQQPLFVGFSGGLDSTTLLHALIQQQTTHPITAIHINHQLSPQADQMQTHAIKFAGDFDIQCICKRITIDQPQRNIESQARNKRLEAFLSCLQKNQYLLLAHHQQDQAETFLLNAFRGSGTLGLQAIKPNQTFQNINIARPLLNVTKQDILKYAKRHQLHWTEDPTNLCQDLDRNWLRHQVLSPLKKRHASISRNLAKCTHQLQQDQQLLNDIAQQDLSQVQISDNQLDRDLLLSFTSQRQKNLLRYWFKQQTHQLPPSSLHLNELIKQINTTSNDQKITWQHQQHTVKRYQNGIYLTTSTQPPQPQYTFSDIQPQQTLDCGFATIQIQSSQAGLKPNQMPKDLTILFRQSTHFKHCDKKKTLKKWFQTHHIPVWQRDYTPVLIQNGKIIGLLNKHLTPGLELSPHLASINFIFTHKTQ